MVLMIRQSGRFTKTHPCKAGPQVGEVEAEVEEVGVRARGKRTSSERSGNGSRVSKARSVPWRQSLRDLSGWSIAGDEASHGEGTTADVRPV